MSFLTSTATNLYTSRVVGSTVVLYQETVTLATTGQAIANLMEDVIAVRPDGRQFAVVAKTAADKAYACTISLDSDTPSTGWTLLGPARGQTSQHVAWVGSRFICARVDAGGLEVVLQTPDGVEVGRFACTPRGTTQGILQYDTVLQQFVLTDVRRNVALPGVTLVKGVRRVDANGEQWWLGQCTVGGDHLRIVRADGYTWRVGPQLEQPQFAIATTRMIANAPLGATTQYEPPYPASQPPTPPPVVKPPEPPIVEPPEPPVVEPPEPVRPPVAFPTDAEFADFSNRLDAKYQTEMQRPPETIHVDPIGRGRWTYDYSLHRQAGDTHEQAWAKVNDAINVIIGHP